MAQFSDRVEAIETPAVPEDQKAGPASSRAASTSPPTCSVRSGQQIIPSTICRAPVVFHGATGGCFRRANRLTLPSPARQHRASSPAHRVQPPSPSANMDWPNSKSDRPLSFLLLLYAALLCPPVFGFIPGTSSAVPVVRCPSVSPAFHRDSTSNTALGCRAFVVPPGPNGGAAPASARRDLNPLSMSMSPAPPVKPVRASKQCIPGGMS